METAPKPNNKEIVKEIVITIFEIVTEILVTIFGIGCSFKFVLVLRSANNSIPVM